MDDHEIPFNTINGEIDKLFDRLEAKGICPCCAATGMMYRAAHLYQDLAGSAEAAALCGDVAGSLGEDDDVGPGLGVRH
jgi:hypothetical protein